MLELFDIPSLINSYGYLGIFIIVFLESGIFFALPGDSLLFTAGLFASAFGLNLLVLIPAIFVATFFGGIVGYEIGTKIEKLNHLKYFRYILKQEHIDKAHRFFEKHGRMSILFCRFVPIVRTFTPIVAGVGKMHYVSFLRYSLAGSALWSTVVTLLGYFLGRSFPIIKNYLSLIVFLIIFVSALPVILEYLKTKKIFTKNHRG